MTGDGRRSTSLWWRSYRCRLCPLQRRAMASRHMPQTTTSVVLSGEPMTGHLCRDAVIGYRSRSSPNLAVLGSIYRLVAGMGMHDPSTGSHRPPPATLAPRAATGRRLTREAARDWPWKVTCAQTIAPSGNARLATFAIKAYLCSDCTDRRTHCWQSASISAASPESISQRDSRTNGTPGLHWMRPLL
jgi:hypothetical protein